MACLSTQGLRPPSATLVGSNSCNILPYSSSTKIPPRASAPQVDKGKGEAAETSKGQTRQRDDDETPLVIEISVLTETSHITWARSTYIHRASCLGKRRC